MRVVTGIATANAADVSLTALNLDRFDVFMVESSGTVDVQGSLDGTNWVSTVLALEDPHSATPATRVLVTAANKMFRVAPGCKFKALRVRQVGATAVATTRLLLGNSGRG